MLYSSLSTNKICTTPFWSNTLSFFLNGQTKLVKGCFNSQMFCLVSQRKSFSMSKCINLWVDEVTCSTKNFVSSLNLLLYVLTKICLYLSFSVTLSFLKFIRCCYVPAISSDFNASTHFYVENPSTVTKPCNCRVTYWNIMLQNGL